MDAILLIIHHFPKNKQKYYFQSLDLIDRVFDTTALDIDLNEVDILLKHGAIYNNAYVTIKKVNKFDKMRLCVNDGVTNKGKVVVKWISL